MKIIAIFFFITIFKSISAYPESNLDKNNIASAVKIIPTDSQYKEIGSKFIFTCTISKKLLASHKHTSDEETWPAIEWKGPNTKIIGESNERVFSERISALKSRLYIRSIQDGDAGLYTCRTVGKDASTFSASNTLLIYTDIKFEKGPSGVEALQGKSVLIPCIATGNPQPDVIWKFKHKKIKKYNDKRHEITGKGLKIHNVKVSDNGSYECNAQVTSQGSFKIKRTSVVVHYPAQISTPLHSPTVIRGSQATFNCPAIANPPPSYQWFKGSASSGKRIHSGDSGFYQVDRVMQADEGEYTCVASNKHGSDSATLDLRVAVPPTLQLSQGPISVLEGRNLVLSCKASSSPVSSFQWRKSKNNTQNTPHSPSYSKVSSSHLSHSMPFSPPHPSSTSQRNKNAHWANGVKSNLHDQELMKSDERLSIRASEEGEESRFAIRRVVRGDEGLYSCQATNMAGTDSKSVFVSVNYLPKAEIKGSRVIYGWLGQKRSIDCLVSGKPLPTIIWTRGSGKGAVLSSTSHHRITTKRLSHDSVTSTLHLSLDAEFEFSMYSNYSCMAKTQYGHNAAKLQLRRAYVPNSPRNISVLNITGSSFILKTSDGPSSPSLSSSPSSPLLSSSPSSLSFSNYILPIQSWVVKYRKDSLSSSSLSSDDASFNINKFRNNHHIDVGGLEGDTEYLILVSASNQVGESDPVKFNIRTKVQPAAFVDDELPQSDQVRMMLRSSLLNRQSGFSRNRHIKSSYWSGMTVGVVVVVAGLLTILATVGTAIAVRNWRYQPGPFSGNPPVSGKRNSNNKIDDDIDHLTLKSNRKLSSVTESSPFIGRYHCESLPKKISNGKNMGGNVMGGKSGCVENGGGVGKKMWPMSSTLPRSTKLEVHENKTASVMDKIEEEKKTKQSHAWKEMMKMTTECKEEEDEDCIMRSDISYESNNGGVKGCFNDPLKCQAANLPPPPNELLSPSNPPIPLPARLVVQPLNSQMAFDPNPVKDNDEDEISFIDDDDDEDDDDVVITDHYNNNTLGYHKNLNFYNNSNRFYPIHNNTNNNNNASFKGQSFRQY